MRSGEIPARQWYFARRSSGNSIGDGVNMQVFPSLADARKKVEAWRVDYNGYRPHSSIGNLTRTEVAAICQAKQEPERAARAAPGVYKAETYISRRPLTACPR
jgi:hypothetical protein